MYIEHKEQILSNFSCQGCGKCCKSSGYVYVKQEETIKIAQSLGISNYEFKRQFVLCDQGWLILSAPNFQPNCFLDPEGKCKIYQARPTSCRTYPNWEYIWVNDESLLEETKLCLGLKTAVQKLAKQT